MESMVLSPSGICSPVYKRISACGGDNKKKSKNGCSSRMTGWKENDKAV